MKFIARICGTDEADVPIVVESDVFEAKNSKEASVDAEISFRQKYKDKFKITTIVIQQWTKVEIFNPLWSSVVPVENAGVENIHWDWY